MLYLILFLAIFSSGCSSIFVVFPDLFSFIPYAEFVLCLPAVLWGAYCWFTSKSLANSWVVILILCVAVSSLLATKNTELGRGMIILANLCSSVALGSALKNLRIVNWAVMTFLTASFVNLVFTIYLSDGARLGSIITSEAGRVTNPNTFGSQMALAFLLTVYCYIIDNRFFMQSRKLRAIPQSVFMSLAGIFFLATLLSGSRGAALALMITCGVFLLGKQLTSLRIVAAMGCMLLGIVLFAVEDGPLEKLTERFRDIETLSTMGDRLPIWTAAVEVLRDNWKTGVGIGGVESALGARLIGEGVVHVTDTGVHRASPHNTYLEWLLSTGFTGAIAAVLTGLIFFRNAFILDRLQYTVFRKSLLVFVCVSSMTLVTYRHHTWIAMGAFVLAFLDNTPNKKTINQAKNRRNIKFQKRIAA